MKVKKKYVAWLLWCVCFIALIVAFTATDSVNGTNESRGPSAATLGNNSPAIAAGGNINNSTINIGVPAVTLQKILDLKEVELSEKQMDEYPHGSILFGLQNGKVVYDTRLKDITFNADWNNTTLTVDHDDAHLRIPNVLIDSPNRIHMELGAIEWYFKFKEGKSSMYPGIALHNLTMWCEVLDAQRGIFRIGFK